MGDEAGQGRNFTRKTAGAEKGAHTCKARLSRRSLLFKRSAAELQRRHQAIELQQTENESET